MKSAFFTVEVLDDRLDDEVAVLQVVEVVRGGHPGEGGVAVLLAELAAVDLLGQRLLRPATMASAVSCLRERSTTVCPAFAATSAMPDPMIPDPMIPTRSIVMGRQATDR